MVCRHQSQQRLSAASNVFSDLFLLELASGPSSSLIWVYAVCLDTYINQSNPIYLADDIFRLIFADIFLLWPTVDPDGAVVRAI